MEAISFYVETYLERDIRDLLNVRHFSDFFRFLRLCAGRTAQTLNASTLAADVGIPPKTALEWMSILETGYIVRRLPPWFANIGLANFFLDIPHFFRGRAETPRGAFRRARELCFPLP